MTLDDLNPRLTNAIVQAESLPAGSREAWEAFHDVSALEESIAKIAPADDLEGEIARLGAVTAALSAGEPLRALQLAGCYLAEDVAPEVAQNLRELMKEADEELVRAASDEPTVEPVTFTLRAA